MKCDDCDKNFSELKLHESHDVPCYLFYDLPNRKARKNKADKLGRHWLCENCHKEFEKKLNLLLKATAFNFSKSYFKEESENGNTKTTTRV